MHDMLLFASNYQVAIDAITADKVLKLRKFKLANDDWRVVEDLVLVLSVCCSLSCVLCNSHSS